MEEDDRAARTKRPPRETGFLPPLAGRSAPSPDDRGSFIFRRRRASLARSCLTRYFQETAASRRNPREL